LTGAPAFHAEKAPLSTAKDWHTLTAMPSCSAWAKLMKAWPALMACAAAVVGEMGSPW
jgi:hypothetical protein